ncbi:MAG: hypothetical protein GY913_11830 [Proteobacteria bacterium]|nr:hypothetical protein [Pseudomonadota bacterium]MCP4917604.1 hypothetical protein [Pseudomonadota bacterium]
MIPLMLMFSTPADAAEVDFSGHYRARALYYDNLSLSDTNPNALGATSFIDHRLRLMPAIHASSRVGVFAQVDMLPTTVFGDSPNTWVNPVDGQAIALAYADGVSPYGDADDGTSYLQNIQVTRAYADVYTDYGRLRFGRMPVDWGVGLLFNDGLDATDEYGDTGDRVQFTTRAGPVYVMGAYELIHEGLLETSGEADDQMQATDLAVAWQTETMALGLYNRYRFQRNPGFRAYNGSLWGHIELGPANVDAEFVGVFGRGDLDTGVNDIQVIAGGLVLDGTIDVDKIHGGLQFGLGTGDTDPTDNVLRDFQFDRDHNVALMMFEEPMPILAPGVVNEANAGRDYDAVRTGDGMSNVLYIRPEVGYQLRPDLAAKASYIAARALQVEETETGNRGYGMEVDLGLTYTPFEHFSAEAMGGVFLPGPYYENYEHDELGGGFDAATFGGRLMLTADF